MRNAKRFCISAIGTRERSATEFECSRTLRTTSSQRSPTATRFTVVLVARRTPSTVPSQIERLQAFAFSAATFKIDDRHFIVTNPIRTPERRVSDIAHELAHVCLEHDLSEVREFAGIPFRTCKPDEEEQATAFGGTLMLPRPLLLRCPGQGLGPAEIAAKYGVSLEMARFRFNTTGVARQLQRH